jgi:hypothetical protein
MIAFLFHPLACKTYGNKFSEPTDIQNQRTGT